MTLSRSDRIDNGEIETKNLKECLAVDFEALLNAAFPDVPRFVRKSLADGSRRGILARMEVTADLLLQAYGPQVVDRLVGHPSDTVRGWGAFTIGHLPRLALGERLSMIQPLADDSHFGVREWAWMAIRKQIVAEIETAVDILVPWTKLASARVRRFASESTRPRGVWAAHIPALKVNPEIALPLLEALNSDPDRYVQDSVGNWLNDAAKSQPQWVKHLCRQWGQTTSSEATAYIIKRAQRSLK